MATDDSDPPDGEGSAALLADIERLQRELMQAKGTIAELEARADIDPLTDILNRRGFERALRGALAYVDRYRTGATLIYIDLDGFKAVNDRLGHAAGDELLKMVARLLTSRVRASDVVARLGGDEFAVLLWNLDAAHAAAKACELEQDIAAAFSKHPVQAGASAGVVTFAGRASPAEMLDAADKAMYARKKERQAAAQTRQNP